MNYDSSMKEISHLELALGVSSLHLEETHQLRWLVCQSWLVGRFKVGGGECWSTTPASSKVAGGKGLLDRSVVGEYALGSWVPGQNKEAMGFCPESGGSGGRRRLPWERRW